MGSILITEINRMKGIMGLSLLSEGIDDLVSKLLKVSDDSAKSISKSADDVGSEFSTALSKVVGGAGTYDDLVSYVSKQGGSVKSVDDIVTFIKSQPDLLKTIATSSDVIMKNAAQTIIQKSDVKTLLTQSTIDVVDDLLLLNIRQNNADTIIPMIDSTITTLRKYESNTNISDLIKKLNDRKNIANNIKSEISATQPKTSISFTPSSVATSFMENFAYSDKSFIQMVNGKPMSGWKIHIYGDDVEDSAKLITKLDDYLKSTESFYKIATDKFYKNSLGTKQQGKALTIYIPYDVVKSGKQKEYFDGISQKLGDYNKTGNISGDKSYNGVIHYRYEYKEPFDALPEGGVTSSDAGKYYESNEGDYMSGTGDKQPDLFNRSSTTDSPIVKQTTDFLSGKRISNRSFNESDIDWTNITNAKNMNDYDKFIANAIQTGDYSRISRSGFERYGINNFREYLMNNISKVNEVNPSIGRWSVNFK